SRTAPGADAAVGRSPDGIGRASGQTGGGTMTDEELEAFFDAGEAAELGWYAERGDVRPLGEHIEAGSELGPEIRAFLVRLLYGEVKRKRGGAPVKASRDRNANIAMQVWMLARLGNDGKGMTLYAAQEECRARLGGMPRKTIE